MPRRRATGESILFFGSEGTRAEDAVLSLHVNSQRGRSDWHLGTCTSIVLILKWFLEKQSGSSTEQSSFETFASPGEWPSGGESVPYRPLCHGHRHFIGCIGGGGAKSQMHLLLLC